MAAYGKFRRLPLKLFIYSAGEREKRIKESSSNLPRLLIMADAAWRFLDGNVTHLLERRNTDSIKVTGSPDRRLKVLCPASCAKYFPSMCIFNSCPSHVCENYLRQLRYNLH